MRGTNNSLGVVDFSSKVDLGRFERVIGRESDRQKEYTSRIRTITLCAFLLAWSISYKEVRDEGGVREIVRDP